MPPNLETPQTCWTHPEVEATATCTGCDVPLCAACAAEADSLCVACARAASDRQSHPPPTQGPKRWQAVLAAIIPGLGHMVLGRPMRALAMLAPLALLSAVCEQPFIVELAIAMWLYQLFDVLDLSAVAAKTRDTSRRVELALLLFGTLLLVELQFDGIVLNRLPLIFAATLVGFGLRLLTIHFHREERR